MAAPHFQHKVMRSVVKVGRMDPSQKIKVLATLRAPVRLTELESKSLKGWCQVSDTAVDVYSFVQPGKDYRLNISFEYSAIGHILDCSCKDFEKERKVCQHMALLQLELAPMSYLRSGLVRYHTEFRASMLETLEAESDQNSASVKTEFLSHVVHRAAQLFNGRDKTKTIQDLDELCDDGKKFLTRLEASLAYSKVRDRQTW